ncbi:MAG: hypothetical protein ONB16_09870 [candidate division KSB1 bacterium]|nr:hypothetical protein [candidate division KSB1 bacterium]MDZ7319460.1 hypothetical protein [candidate division KSB1 bacterium]MDZ7340395.1 hypothetical protein [candidate division KSB1 bacterium]
MRWTRFPLRAIMALAVWIQLTTTAIAIASGWGPYISPGIKFGWDSIRGFTMGLKFGIGLNNPDRGIFVNLTIGVKAFEQPRNNGHEYIFLDGQVGSLVPKIALLTCGAGAGLMFGIGDAASQVVPRTTVFAGFIVFPTLDFTFWGADKVSYEPGGEVTLPVPLYKLDLGFD